MDSATPESPIDFTQDQANGVPIYRQIIRRIEHGVLSGRLKTGDKLPTVRSLAVNLKINHNTVAKAYGELEIRGILATQVGSGTYVSDKKPAPEEDALNTRIREALVRFLKEMRDLGVDKEGAIRLIGDFNKDTVEVWK
jgi:GntR family transcriptional regulator